MQNLGDSFMCNIEKVFLCTGADGYVPKYNPDHYEYGCLADAASLLYRFKIIVSVFALHLWNLTCLNDDYSIITNTAWFNPLIRLV